MLEYIVTKKKRNIFWCDYTKSYPEITEDWIAKTPKKAANVGEERSCADKKNKTDGLTDWRTGQNIIPSATRCVGYNLFTMVRKRGVELSILGLY